MTAAKACRIPIFLLAAALAPAASFTIDQVLSAPFPSDLSAAPTGKKFAWVMDARGLRNIWIATAPDFQARQITNYTADDGQELSDLAWSPDGSAIAYVRGGDANGRGEIPNPAHDPAGASQSIYVAQLTGGSPKLIANGTAPLFAPDGKSIVWIKSGQVWTAPLDGSSPARQLLHTRGSSGGLRWSPDGSRLAFVSARGDHAFIGVYTVASQEIRYLDPSVDLDSEPAWSPDSKRIAFRRIPTQRERAFYSHPVRRAAVDPWSVRVADVVTGVGREVFQAAAGTGSAFRDMVAGNQILWGAGDRIVFPWERDGWLHLYSVDPSGGAALLLTPGEFEIERVWLAPDRKSVIYSSNQGDIDRRHLWRVPVDAAAPVALTSGDGIEFAAAPLDDNHTVAILHCDARVPARPAVLAAGEKPRDIARDTMPGDFPASALVDPQAVTIDAADGMAIHGQLFLPPGYDKTKRYSSIVFFHGGSRRQMLLGWHYMFYYHQAYGFNQYLASKGFIVLSVNYRGGIGYGLDFREAQGFGPNGGSEYNDVIGAGLFLRHRGDIDPARIGVWGGSYGGYLVGLALARASDMFAAGVDLHGVHDWNQEITNRWPEFQPEKQPAVARLALQSSPMAYVDTWRSPVLLIQGDDDRNVVFSQTVMLAEALRKQKVHFEQLIFPDEVHDFLMHAHWLQAYQASDAFLSKYLMK